MLEVFDPTHPESRIIRMKMDSEGTAEIVYKAKVEDVGRMMLYFENVYTGASLVIPKNYRFDPAAYAKFKEHCITQEGLVELENMEPLAVCTMLYACAKEQVGRQIAPAVKSFALAA